MSTQFWRNLWIHKPHTKKKDDPIPTTPRPFPIPYIASSKPPPPPTAPPTTSPTHVPSPSSTAFPSSPPHGLGCGAPATQPAWLTQASSSTSQPTHPQHTTAPVTQPSQLPPSSSTSNTIIKQEPSPSKKSRLFFMTVAPIFKTSSPALRPMPLDIDNGLPAIILRFGNSSTPPLHKSVSPVMLIHVQL